MGHRILYIWKKVLLTLFGIVTANSSVFGSLQKWVCGIGLFYTYDVFIDPRGFAPSGWHVPTRAEINTLKSYVGADPGGKLKEKGFDWWLSPNTGATDEYKFRFRGNGFRSRNGAFANLKRWGYLSSITLNGSGGTYGDNLIILLASNTATIFSEGQNETHTGYSTRFLKDDSNDPGFVIGNNGRVYNTIKIGNQVWIDENAVETQFQNGDFIPEIAANSEWTSYCNTRRPALCIYSNNWDYICGKPAGYPTWVKGELSGTINGLSTCDAIIGMG